jgi:hypothetical protein
MSQTNVQLLVFDLLTVTSIHVWALYMFNCAHVYHPYIYWLCTGTCFLHATQTKQDTEFVWLRFCCIWLLNVQLITFLHWGSWNWMLMVCLWGCDFFSLWASCFIFCEASLPFFLRECLERKGWTGGTCGWYCESGGKVVNCHVMNSHIAI